MGQFIFTPCGIDGLFVIEPKLFGDSRGYFFESYNKKDFAENGISAEFVQDNESSSSKNVLRGLHFQKRHPQCKLVRCTQGEVFDVAVDIRKESRTYGKWFGITLSAENKKMFFIPEGFAHGFYVLSDTAVFNYKCTDFYHPEDEGGIMWNDAELNIKWPIEDNRKPTLSGKDLSHKPFSEMLFDSLR